MALHEDDLKEYTLKDFRHYLSRIVGEVAHGQKRIRVTSYGKTAGYFISEEELTYLDTIEEEHDRQEIERILIREARPEEPASAKDKDWWDHQIDVGIQQVKEGRLLTSDEVYARLKAKMDARKSPPA